MLFSIELGLLLNAPGLYLFISMDFTAVHAYAMFPKGLETIGGIRDVLSVRGMTC